MAKTSYALSNRIARGGMAEIYLGKASGGDGFERIVAIKRILPHYAGDHEFIEMFRDEAHICKRLQHANIVQVFDFTEVDNSYALIMEHVDGADLRTLLSACESARIRPSVPMVIYIAACAARGLHYAHTKVDEVSNRPLGIVHRDISPQNILISYDGDVKITDFGIASAGNKITETRPGVVKGKYSYMSPEQVAARPLDGRSDVFSLAIVLWEALAMKRLFAGNTEVESIRKVQQADITYKLTDLNKEVDDELMEIVHKGLAKDRKKRFQTAAAFEKALLKYLHSRYADFIASELGDFLKQILAQKRGKSIIDIKQALTQPKIIKPATRGGLTGALQQNETKENTVAKASVNLDMEVTHHQTKLELDKQPTSAAVRVVGHRSSFQPSKQERVHSPHPIGVIHRNSVRRKPHFFMMFFLATFLTVIFTYPKWIEFIDDQVHLDLQTSPSNVSLMLNGKQVNDGMYVDTPLTLDLPPGKYELVVERPGYLPETVNFQGSAGEKLKPAPIYMKKDPAADLVSLRITSDAKMYVNVQEGLEKGFSPLVVPNLTRNLEYWISFTSANKGQKRTGRCIFKPTLYKNAKSFTIDIQERTGGKFRCQVRTR
jgi:serine/threonine protein kinase